MTLGSERIPIAGFSVKSTDSEFELKRNSSIMVNPAIPRIQYLLSFVP